MRVPALVTTRTVTCAALAVVALLLVPLLAPAQEHPLVISLGHPGKPGVVMSGTPITIRLPRVNVPQRLPGNLPGRDYVYRFPEGYVRSAPLLTVPQSQVQIPRGEASASALVPGDNLNGVLTSVRNPQARANSLSVPAQRDARYSNLEVSNVQQELRRRGYYAGAVDGQLGPETEVGIQRFQVDQRQPVTGLIDRSVLSRLGLTTPAR